MLGRSQDKSGQKKPRRPRSKAETEKRRRLLIVVLIVAAVVASLSVVGYGYYDTNVKPWRQPILKVNGTTIDMRTFVKSLRLQQQYASYFSSQAEWAQYVVSGLEQNELNRQGLAGFGVDINEVASREAIDAKMRESLISFDRLTDNATDEEFQEARRTLGKDIQDQAGISVEDYEKLALVPSLISAEMQKQVGDRDYPATDNYDHARVQALLVSGADEASLARMKWENGADFDALAGEEWVSSSIRDTSTTDNVTPQWTARGLRSTTFDNCTFNMPVGMLGDPVQDSDSEEDYWLVNVLAREARPLAEADRDTLVSNALSKWMEEAKTSPENVIVNYIDQEGGAAKLAWAFDHVEV